MSVNEILRTPFTPDVRKAQFEQLKEYLEFGLDLECEFPIEYDEFEVLYDVYYFIARPMKEDKEILELLSRYVDFVEQYWESIEMPLKEENGEDEEELETKVQEHPLYQIADSIANGNIFVIHDVEESLLNYEEYYREHLEAFMERGISEEDCKEEPLEMCWIGLADALEENGYAVEIDWRESSFDLADKLSSCKLMKANSSLLNKGWFSMEEGVLEGCKTLNKKWRGQGLCIAAMDIHCDSYVFFPCKEKELEKLEKLANEMGYVICHSKFLTGYELESGAKSDVYFQIENHFSEKFEDISKCQESEYANLISTMENMTKLLVTGDISQNEEKEIIKNAIYIRIYLFSMPHMEYTEEMRRSFFEACWKLYRAFGENRREEDFMLDSETEFLLRTTSNKTQAVLSVWNKEQLEQGICNCCGKKLPVTAYEDCKKKQPVSKVLQEWDLLAVAKSMVSKSRENFQLYKKVSKLFGLITCEECGQEQTLLDAYLAWCYENTYLKYPDEKMLEWLYQECKNRLSASEYRDQRRYYYQLIVAYAHGMKDLEKSKLLKYYEVLYDSYKYNREKYANELKYYKEKCNELTEELLQTSSLSKEEQEKAQLAKLNIEYENLGKKVRSPKEFEEVCNQLAHSYDEILGKGNEMSTNCKLRLALALGRINGKEEHAIEVLLEQLEILERYNPTKQELISEIYERVAYIYKEYLKNYEEAIRYFKGYIKCIEEIYGESSEYACGEKLEVKRIEKLFAKQKSKSQNKD